MARVLDGAKKRVKKVRKGKTRPRWGVLGVLLLAVAAGVGYAVSRATRKDDDLESEATERDAKV